MLKYALRRIAEVVPTTIGILLLAFALFNVVGGSPAEAILGKNASAESIAAFNHKYGYDRPLVFARDSQFIRFAPPIPARYRFPEKGAFVVRSLLWQASNLDVCRDLFLRFVNSRKPC